MPKRRIPNVRLVCLLVPCAIAAMTAVAAADDSYKDDQSGFSLTVPAPWEPTDTQGYTVPGTLRAVWKGAGNASITAFVQSPGRAFSPRFLVDESAKAMADKLGCTVKTADVRTVGGMKAMWLVATGKGTGGALTGQGDVETTTHWVAIPREKDVIVILLTCPAADYDTNKVTFEKAIGSMKLDGTQTPEQAEAK